MGNDHKQRFFALALACGVLRFGDFVLKSGRRSPYFFNAGLFHSGASLASLGEFYAQAAIASGITFDLVFGPAYKGIPLAAATAIGLARSGRDVGYAFNRKEAKDHGERGVVIGHPLRGHRVLIVDDVISSGLSVAEAVALIQAEGATGAGVIIALDRQERGTGTLSAVDEVRRHYGLPVFSVANLEDLLSYLRPQPAHAAQVHAIETYLSQYGVTG
ncbi:MAG: orotate phosphoribosyltransferase [Acidiferrobacteraceae bacterium]